jgi:DNA-binding NarL/FixJ family response regulator
MNPDVIRVFCVDDHPMIIEGLVAAINRQTDMVVVGCAASANEAVAAYDRERPDVMLMDLMLSNSNGVDAIHAIRAKHPVARIIVLTVCQGDEDVFRALDAGAVGYVLKEEVSADLVRAIRDVHSGKVVPMRPDLEERLAKRASTPGLTTREIEVLQLVSLGLRNKEIAAVLGVAEDTARVHVKNILAKLQVNDRTAAVNVGVRRGIIRLT